MGGEIAGEALDQRLGEGVVEEEERRARW